MIFPEWTEIQTYEQNAIQFLRLNQLRDHINEILFPYLITITPYFRMVSWLAWIFTRLEEEMRSSSGMNTREYVNKSLRYYGILATADILHAKARGAYHRGPIGVRALENKLDLLRGDVVDYNHPSFSRPLDPTPIYRSSLVAMRLFEERQQPISARQFLSILIPTERGKTLAKTFEGKWSGLVSPRNFTNKVKWKIALLRKLGRLVDLQGLSPKDEESKLLQDAARSSMKYPEIYDDFVDIAVETVTKSDERGFKVFSSDIAKAALYRAITLEEETIPIKLKDTQAAALLAYHELHTHMAFGADAILNGLVNLSKGRFTGMPKQKILTESSKFLAKITRSERLVGELYKEIKKSFRSYTGKYQTGYPRSLGRFGFESTRERIIHSEDYSEQIAFGAIVLLQSAVCQGFFKPKWMTGILPYHRKVFSAYTLLEEYQSLPSGAAPRDWLEATIDLIIQNHDDVANSKGLYAKRFDCRDGRLFYRADAEFDEQRGRLINAVLWLSDIGIIGIDQGLFTVSE